MQGNHPDRLKNNKISANAPEPICHWVFCDREPISLPFAVRHEPFNDREPRFRSGDSDLGSRFCRAVQVLCITSGPVSATLPGLYVPEPRQSPGRVLQGGQQHYEKASNCVFISLYRFIFTYFNRSLCFIKYRLENIAYICV